MEIFFTHCLEFYAMKTEKVIKISPYRSSNFPTFRKNQLHFQIIFELCHQMDPKILPPPTKKKEET